MGRNQSSLQKDPFVESSYGIQLMVRGKPMGYFTTIEGGEMSIKLIEHDIVYQNGSSRTLFIPGQTSFEPITLSHGVTDDLSFWQWWQEVANGIGARLNASIFAFGPLQASSAKNYAEETGTSVAKFTSADAAKDKFKKFAQWDLEDVWPLSISGFSFDTDSTDVFIASVTLVAENITRVA